MDSRGSRGNAPRRSCRVLSYNLNLLPALIGYGDGYADERIADFAERCAKSYDLLILQEVYAAAALPRAAQAVLCGQKKLLRALELHGFGHQVIPKQPSYVRMVHNGSGGDAGLVIASRYPIVGFGAHYFTDVSEDLASGSSKTASMGSDASLRMSKNKGIVHAKVMLSPGHTLTCFNTHMQPLSSRRSRDQITAIIETHGTELRRYVDLVVHDDPTTAVLVTGDMNVNAIDPRHGMLDDLQQPSSGVATPNGALAAPEHGWQYQAFLEAFDPDHEIRELVFDAYGDHPSTRPPLLEYPDTLAGLQKHHYPARHDYAFFRPPRETQSDLAVQAVTDSVMIDKMQAPAGRPFRGLSDHFGIAFDLVVAPMAVELPASQAIGLAQPLGATGSLRNRRHHRLNSSSQVDDQMPGAIVILPQGQELLDAAAQQLEQSGAVPRRREYWLTLLSPFAMSRKGGPTATLMNPSLRSRISMLPEDMAGLIEAVFWPAFLYLLWMNRYVRFTVLAVLAFYLLKLASGNTNLQFVDSEKKFGHVNADVKQGRAPVVLTSRNKSPKKRKSRTSTAASESPVGFLVAEAGSTTLSEGFTQTVDRVGWRRCLSAKAPGRSGPAPVQSLSYKDVHVKIGAFARALEQHGVRKGDVVGLHMETSMLGLIGHLAALRLGAVTLLLTGEQRTIRHLLDTTECQLVICTRSFTARVIQSRSRCLQSVVQLSPVEDEEAHLASELGIPLLAADRLMQDAANAGALLDGAGGDEDGSHLAAKSPAAVTDDAVITFSVSEASAPSSSSAPASNTMAPAIVIQRHSHKDLLAALKVMHDTNLVPVPRLATAASSNEDQDTLMVLAPRNTLFELLCIHGWLLAGHLVAFGDPMTIYEELRLFKPKTLLAEPVVFQTLQSQYESMRSRWRVGLRAIHDRVYRFRAELQRHGRDSKTLRRLFFKKVEQHLGGHVSRVILHTSQGTSPFQLKEFIQIGICPRVREVICRPEAGIVTIDGIPAPRRLMKLLPLASAPTPSANDAAGNLPVGELLYADEEPQSGQEPEWKSSGLVASWRSETLDVLCPTDALVWPQPDLFANAADLERRYRAKLRLPLIVNMHITCMPGRPLVAMIVPNREAVEDLVNSGESLVNPATNGGSGGAPASPSLLPSNGPLPWGSVVDLATPFLQRELDAIHKQLGLHEAFRICAIHLHPHPFTQHSDFLLPTGGQRRRRIAQYFESRIIRLYQTMGTGGDAESSEDQQQVPSSPLMETPSSLLPVTTSSPGTSQQMFGQSPTFPAVAELPSHLPEPVESQGFSFSAPVSVDIGGTCAKVVFFRPPEAPSGLPPYCVVDSSHALERVILQQSVADSFFTSPTQSDNGDAVGVLRFAKMPSNKVPDFIEYLKNSGIHGYYNKAALAAIPATGGGAYKYSRLVDAKLGLRLKMCKEMDGIIKGLNFLLEHSPSSIFTYDLEKDRQAPHKLDSNDVSPVAATATVPRPLSSSIFPYLLVNIGSGVSIVKCTSLDGNFERVGGSPIGGATFWGLVRAMTSIRTWEEVHEMTRIDGPGDNTNVDLLVGDIYGFGATGLPARLSVDTVASTFGKLGADRVFNEGPSPANASPGGAVGQGGSGRDSSGTPSAEDLPGSGRATPNVRGDLDNADTHSIGSLDHEDDRDIDRALMGLGPAMPRAVDIVRSLLIMIANNVTQLAFLTCRAEKVDHVFFTGGFVRDNPIVWRQISRALNYWTGGSTNAHFLVHDGYLGALGSLMETADSVPPAENA